MGLPDLDAAPGAAVRRLLGRSEALRQQYLSAGPWPHLLLHDVLPAALVAAAERECLAVPAGALRTVPTARLRKQEANDVAALGPATQALLDLLDGPLWVELVERVTGVPGLAPDASHYGPACTGAGPGTSSRSTPTSPRTRWTGVTTARARCSTSTAGGSRTGAGRSSCGRPTCRRWACASCPGRGRSCSGRPTATHPTGCPSPSPPPTALPACRSRPTSTPRRRRAASRGAARRRSCAGQGDPWWVGLPTRGDLGRAVLPAQAWSRVSRLVRPTGLPRHEG